jgi:hypothetical protein
MKKKEKELLLAFEIENFKSDSTYAQNIIFLSKYLQLNIVLISYRCLTLIYYYFM